jgi:hypothetical protein
VELIIGASERLNKVFYIIYEHLLVRESGYLYKAPFVDLKWGNKDKSKLSLTLRELKLTPEAVLTFKFRSSKNNKIKKLILFK